MKRPAVILVLLRCAAQGAHLRAASGSSQTDIYSERPSGEGIASPKIIRSISHLLDHGEAAEFADHVTDVAIAANPSDCNKLSGAGWGAPGDSPISPETSTAPASWLCVQRDPKASSALSKVSFTLKHASDSRSCEDGDGANQSSFGSAAAVHPGLGREAQHGCARLGPSWRLLQGHISSSGPASCVWQLCGEFHERTHANAKHLVQHLSLLTTSSARYSACGNSRVGMRSELVSVPGFQVRKLMDDNPRICLVRKEAKVVQTLNAPRTLPALAFPSRKLEVASDPSREHFFVIGAETSGTRLWTHLVASGRGVPTDKFDSGNFQGHGLLGDDTAVHHLSLPWGARCQTANEDFVFEDFGGSTPSFGWPHVIDYFSLVHKGAEIQNDPSTLRFFVDPLALIRHHQQRGDPVRVVLVVRDPRASMAGKMIDHCTDQQRGEAEQRKAFELMLAAAQANLTETTTVCYEEMVSDPSYIRRKLEEMGISPGDLPEIRNGNSKHDFVGVNCTFDMHAYQVLCPSTELAKEVAQVCS